MRSLLPGTITLPAVAEIDHRALQAALGGPSKAVLSVWRHKGFPASRRAGRTTLTTTADVAAWAVARGCEVRFV